MSGGDYDIIMFCSLFYRVPGWMGEANLLTPTSIFIENIVRQVACQECDRICGVCGRMVTSLGD